MIPLRQERTSRIILKQTKKGYESSWKIKPLAFVRESLFRYQSFSRLGNKAGDVIPEGPEELCELLVYRSSRNCA